MFGRRKRTIEREGEDLKKRLDDLEGEAERLHEEIETLETHKNDPYYERPIRPSGSEDHMFPLNPRLRPVCKEPTRRQHRKQRNLAWTLIIVSVFLLTWIVAKVLRHLS